MKINMEQQTYHTGQCAPFKRSREKYGRLSNMTGGFPLAVNGLSFQSPEGLYQALKFQRNPVFQKHIGSRNSGMEAKKAAYAGRTPIMPNWDSLRVQAMLYTTAVKLAQHTEAFTHALLETGSVPIVENSSRDQFWGASPATSPPTFQGINVLGKILTLTRDTLIKSKGDVTQTIEELTRHVPMDQFSVNNATIPIPKTNTPFIYISS